MTHRSTAPISRRQFVRASGLACAGAVLARPVRASAEPGFRVLETKVISHQPELYHGWPTLARRRDGDLLLAYSGGREAHVCPFGRVEMMVSHDDGRTWGWPRVLLDGFIDDRDAGVVETAKGSLLVTTFSSLAYEGILSAASRKKPGESGAWPPERLGAWKAAHERLDAERRQAELGQWMLRSSDGGVTWSARYGCIVNSPHGPIQLSDGRLLYAGRELWTGDRRVGVCESADDGKSWRWLADIPARPGDTARDYHELHAVETAEGRLVVHIRNHNAANARELLQTESDDGGRSWSVPHPVGVWGLPPHLLRLKDGRLLVTYGYRRPPYGNQARLSGDEGRTWSDPLTISGDGASGDLGYPSTAELEDGSFVTVWYELLKGTSRAALRQARWTL